MSADNEIAHAKSILADLNTLDASDLSRYKVAQAQAHALIAIAEALNPRYVLPEPVAIPATPRWPGGAA